MVEIVDENNRQKVVSHIHSDDCMISAERYVARGEFDALGDEVQRVLVGTDHFIIYSVALPRRGDIDDGGARKPIDPAIDHLWLRAVLPDNYECARTYRNKLGEIAGDLALICDAVDDVCASGSLSSDRSASVRSRTIAMMARAMEMTFEGQSEEARLLLQRLLKQITTLRDSKNRMYYILANIGALLLLIIAWLVLRNLTPDPLVVASVEAGSTIGLGKVLLIDVLLFGALGSFFSLSTTIASIRVNHSISWLEMLYAGAVRVPIGVIAAAVTVLLISGEWMLGSLDNEVRPWSYLLFGFLAGFSEFFVPNALKQIENGTQITVPSWQDGSISDPSAVRN